VDVDKGNTTMYTGTCQEELIKVILRENSFEEEYNHFSTLFERKEIMVFVSDY